MSWSWWERDLLCCRAVTSTTSITRHRCCCCCCCWWWWWWQAMCVHDHCAIVIARLPAGERRLRRRNTKPITAMTGSCCSHIDAWTATSQFRCAKYVTKTNCCETPRDASRYLEMFSADDVTEVRPVTVLKRICYRLGLIFFCHLHQPKRCERGLGNGILGSVVFL